MRLKIYTCCLLLAFVATTGFSQHKIYVDHTATGANDGTTWTNAYVDLQDALANAIVDDSIWVATGTYYPSTTDRTAFFDIPHTVYIYGGFDGTETALSQRDYVANPCILSGDINMDGLPVGNSFTILYMKLACDYSLIDGFTIIGGRADDADMTGDDRHKNGGAVYIDGGTSNGGIPVFRHCVFIDNYASKFGGAIYANGISGGYAHYAVESCAFLNNRSIQSGGAIQNDKKCSPVIVNSIFTGNISSFGGAIYNNGTDSICSPSIVNCIFNQNRAFQTGGAMYSFGKNISGTSNPLVVNCLIYNNTSDISAAGLYCLTDGGTSEMVVTNSTFYNNYAGAGTVGGGGHIYVNESNAGLTKTTVRNSIFWNSNSASAPYFRFSASGAGNPEIDLDYCLVDAPDCATMKEDIIGALTCGTNMLYNDDPEFSNPAAGDFTLTAISPAVDYGDETFLPLDHLDFDKDGNTTELLPLDLVWNIRVYGPNVDLGPYEFDSPPAPLGALPIELVSFTARPKGGKVELNWVTLSEENNDYFTIERSENGIDFEPIHREEGAGTSSFARNYQVYDNNPFAGKNYYRLKQTDFDGRFEYSDIRVVTILEEGQLTTYPNPVTNTLHVALSGFNVRNVDYEIYHLSGKMMYNGASEVNEGVVVISLEEVSQLLPGSYIIRIVNERGGDLYGKFLKVGL